MPQKQYTHLLTNLYYFKGIILSNQNYLLRFKPFKVLFWEGHKNLKRSFILFCHYVLSNVKTKWTIFFNFVAFLQYMNCMYCFQSLFKVFANSNEQNKKRWAYSLDATYYYAQNNVFLHLVSCESNTTIKLRGQSRFLQTVQAKDWDHGIYIFCHSMMGQKLH